MKSSYLLEQVGGRVVFATGTPISNTMAEMYTMLRYLSPGLLQERGVEHFDAWAGNFAEAVTALELVIERYGRFLDPILARISSESPWKAKRVEQYLGKIPSSIGARACR
jgi:hypothetical protein